MNSTLIILIIAFGIFFIIRLRYITCPKGKILVIYGNVSNPNEFGCEVLAGGGKFVYPVIQLYEFIDLTEYKFDYQKELYTKDDVKVKFNLRMEYAVSNNEELSKFAAVRLLGKDRKEISEIANALIAKVIIEWITNKDIVDLSLEINNNQEFVILEILSKIKADINKIGIDIVHFELGEIKDLNNQIEAIIEEYYNISSSQQTKSTAFELKELSEINAAIEKKLLREKAVDDRKIKNTY